MMNRGKLEHILAYARQQKQFGSPTCRIPPGDMVEIMERLLAQPVSQGGKLDSLNIRAVSALREAVRNQWLKSNEFAEKVYWHNMHSIANEIIEAMAAAPEGGN